MPRPPAAIPSISTVAHSPPTGARMPHTEHSIRGEAAWISTSLRRRRRFAPRSAASCARTCPAALSDKVRTGKRLTKADMVKWHAILNVAAGSPITGRSSGAARAGASSSATSSTSRPRWRTRRGSSPSASTCSARCCSIWLGRAEEALAAAHPRRLRLVVPGLLGAGRRLRSRRPQERGAARRRPLRRQRAEDLDDARPIRRHDLLPGAHRSHGEEAGGHLLPAHRHEDARRSRSARSSCSTASMR